MFARVIAAKRMATTTSSNISDGPVLIHLRNKLTDFFNVSKSSFHN
jgi:hypothetical protein